MEGLLMLLMLMLLVGLLAYALARLRALTREVDRLSKQVADLQAVATANGRAVKSISDESADMAALNDLLANPAVADALKGLGR